MKNSAKRINAHLRENGIPATVNGTNGEIFLDLGFCNYLLPFTRWSEISIEEWLTVAREYVAEHAEAVELLKFTPILTVIEPEAVEEKVEVEKPRKLSKTEAIKEELSADEVSLSKGVYTARWGFYYTNGVTIERFLNRVKSAYPSAVIVDSDEIWKNFKGGAVLRHQSHWYVKFAL